MRALVVRFSSLGDVILISSILPHLKREGFKVDLLTFKPFGELFKGQPFVDKVIEVKREELRSLSGIRELGKSLENYDLAFDLHNNLRSRLLKFFLRFPVYTYKKRGFLRRAMTVIKPLKAKWLYVPELYSEPLRSIGINIKDPRPYLEVDNETLSSIKKKTKKLKEFIVVAPGARWETKAYPITKFMKVVSILKERGYNVVTVGGAKEREKGRVLEKAGAINLCGELKLKESLALIKLSKGVISNDSAVVHMARAVRTPVISIFGPTHPALGFAPKDDEGKAITLNLPCSPCSIHGKTRCKRRACFEIKPEMIVNELLSFIE